MPGLAFIPSGIDLHNDLLEPRVLRGGSGLLPLLALDGLCLSKLSLLFGLSTSSCLCLLG